DSSSPLNGLAWSVASPPAVTICAVIVARPIAAGSPVATPAAVITAVVAIWVDVCWDVAAVVVARRAAAARAGRINKGLRLHDDDAAAASGIATPRGGGCCVGCRAEQRRCGNSGEFQIARHYGRSLPKRLSIAITASRRPRYGAAISTDSLP